MPLLRPMFLIGCIFFEVDMKEFMKKAIKLAKLGVGKVNPNPLVGAVIVKDGNIIGAGYHKGFGGPHAEIEAFNSLTESAEGADMYVTLEPCNHFGKTPPCSHAIVENGIKKVYVATLDPNPLVAGTGVSYLREHGVDVEVGLLSAEAKKINEVFLKYITTKRPFVHLKIAMSLDGKIATRTGESKWISSEESREEVHHLRNKYAGIMVGLNTILQDNPHLTARVQNGKNPIRIICDSKLNIPLDANVLDHKAETIIATCSDKELSGVNMIRTTGEIVNLNELMIQLGERGIDSILLEGGSTLAYSALESGIVDKVTFYVAPKLIGGKDSPTPLGGVGVDSIKDTFNLNKVSTRVSGSDVVIEGYIE